MTYHGPLFGKIGRKFIPLKLTAEDVDRMQLDLQAREREIEELWETAPGDATQASEYLSRKLRTTEKHLVAARKERDELRKWTTENGVLALVDERDQWKAEAERWRGIVENTTP